MIRYPNNWVKIILNDRLFQPLFGINLAHIYFVHEGGDIEIELTGDSTVKNVSTTME